MKENSLQNAMNNSQMYSETKKNTMNNNQMDSETKKKIEENCLGPQNDQVTNTVKDISIFFFREP